jgi:hypothetical protein
MSRLVGSLLLSILMFPLASVLYLIVFFVADLKGFGPGANTTTAIFIAGVATWAFVAWYWILTWRKSVTWGAARLNLTALAALASAGIAAGAGAATSFLEREFGYFIGSITAPALWLMATVLVWRETAAERAARLRAAGPAILCPTCGYDMTGLKGTRCPECGCEFTLDELLASQPGKAAVELER